MENPPLNVQRSNISEKVNSSLKVESDWKTFLNKIRGWIGLENVYSGKFNHFVNPSLLIIGIASLLILLKAYTNILNTIEEIPFAPSLFEVIGTLWLIRFSTTRLLRKQDRQQFRAEMTNRWRIFLGQEETTY